MTEERINVEKEFVSATLSDSGGNSILLATPGPMAGLVGMATGTLGHSTVTLSNGNQYYVPTSEVLRGLDIDLGELLRLNLSSSPELTAPEGAIPRLAQSSNSRPVPRR